MRELSISVKDCMDTFVFGKIFEIFPNLRMIRVNGNSFANEVPAGEAISRTEIRLERLILLDHPFRFESLRYSGLTELDIPVTEAQSTGPRKEGFLHFLSSQSRLTVVKLEMKKVSCQAMVKETIFTVLRHQALRDFSVSSPAEVSFSSEDVERLITSVKKLRCLTLDVFISAEWLPPASPNMPAMIEELVLKNGSYEGENKIYSHLLVHCPSLKDLRFANPTALVLSEILETKQNLERLTLSAYPVIGGNAAATFAQQQFSMEKLSKLKTLKIQDPDKVLFTDDFVKRMIGETKIADVEIA